MGKTSVIQDIWHLLKAIYIYVGVGVNAFHLLL